MLKAKLVKPQRNAKNYSREKELVEAWSIVGKVKGELKEIVTCRAYMGRSASASVVYVSLWVYGLDCSGSGIAGGYGYHKVSAAVGSAISSAGIELFGDVYDGNRYNYDLKRAYTTEELAAINKKAMKSRAYINGVGDSAIEAALLAIARLAGGRGKLTIVRH